jgi:hypothetical protein
VKTNTDFANVVIWAAFPERIALNPVMGRMAIGPTMKTAATTCKTLKSVSMPQG